MIELTYEGHYQTRDGRTIYAVNPQRPDGSIQKGDEVKIGNVVFTVIATEHFMSTAHPIVGVVVR